MDRDQQIGPDDITLPENDPEPSPNTPGKPKTFHEAIENHKRLVIEGTLKKTGGNQTKAAKLLGLQRTYLVRLIRLLKISAKD